MKRFMLGVTAFMCLAGFSPPSFADEMGKMKGGVKGEMKGKGEEMRAKHDEMKGSSMKGEMKGKADEMKGAMGK